MILSGTCPVLSGLCPVLSKPCPKHVRFCCPILSGKCPECPGMSGNVRKSVRNVRSGLRTCSAIVLCRSHEHGDGSNCLVFLKAHPLGIVTQAWCRSWAQPMSIYQYTVLHVVQGFYMIQLRVCSVAVDHTWCLAAYLGADDFNGSHCCYEQSV
jgi:hypothetical protein